VVEAGRSWQRLEGKGPGHLRVVPALRLPLGPSHVDAAHRVQARIPRRVGVDPQEQLQVDLEPCLLQGLPPRRVRYALPPVHEAAGQRPAERLEATLDQDDRRAGVELDDHVHGGDGMVAGTPHAAGAPYCSS
jgi:hypothetical protein